MVPYDAYGRGTDTDATCVRQCASLCVPEGAAQAWCGGWLEESTDTQMSSHLWLDYLSLSYLSFQAFYQGGKDVSASICASRYSTQGGEKTRWLTSTGTTEKKKKKKNTQ